MESQEADGVSSKDFYRWLQDRAGERILVDKSPSYALDPDALRNAERGFDAPRYIHLVRDPLAMSRSFESYHMDQILFLDEHEWPGRTLGDLGDLVRVALAVVQSRVDIDDLAQAITAEFERGGHESEAPFADVVRGPPVVIERGIAVGDHHLGEGQPVGDIAGGAVIVERHLVDDRSFAIVEPEPHRPVLPLQLGAVDGERRALRLGDVQRLEVRAHLRAPDGRGVFGVNGGTPVVVVVLDLEQLEGVHVHQQLQTGDGMGIRVAVGRLPRPEVAPPETPVPVLLRHEGFSVGPHVDQHQTHVGEPTRRE